jgi:hypothetical protein
LQGRHVGGDYESDSDYIPSVYNSDTNSDAESVRSSSSSFSKQKKIFKPSTKKKIQLTIENLTVKTIPKQKGFFFYKYGVATESKTILDKISGTFVPGQFVAVLGASGKFNVLTMRARLREDDVFESSFRQSCGTKRSTPYERKDTHQWEEQREDAWKRVPLLLCPVR